MTTGEYIVANSTLETGTALELLTTMQTYIHTWIPIDQVDTNITIDVITIDIVEVGAIDADIIITIYDVELI